MSVSATAHLNFRGNAREALTFYHSVFGGQIMIATYADVGVPEDSSNAADRAVFAPVGPDSADADHVAFGMVAAENGLRLAAYDVFGTSGGGVATAQLPTWQTIVIRIPASAEAPASFTITDAAHWNRFAVPNWSCPAPRVP